MNKDNDISNLHLYGELTTMKNDYRNPPAEYVKQFHLYKGSDLKTDRPREIVSRKRWPTCNESLTTLRSDVHVPFNLLWTTKPIVGHRKLQRTIVEKPVDCGLEESIKTRPRVFLAPSVAMDDVSNKEKRDLLLNYMYTTQFRANDRDLTTFRNLSKKKRTECCCGVADEAKDEDYEYMINNSKGRILANNPEPCGVSPEMRMKYYKAWDERQRRACVNPTLFFWNHTDKPRNISVEDGLITPEMKEEISELTRRDKLRLPHDMPMTGYTAHRVELALGCPMRRRDFPISHPTMTVQQAWYNRYELDMEEVRNKRNSS